MIEIYGLGTIGSNVCYNLFMYDGDIKVMAHDFDKVNDRNLGPTVYELAHVNHFKTHAMMAALSNILHKIPRGFEHSYKKVTSVPKSCNANLLIDCFDNFQSRDIVAATAEKFGTPVVHLGFAGGENLIGSVCWDKEFIRNQKTVAGDICDWRPKTWWFKAVTGMFSRSIIKFLETGEKESYIVGENLRILK